MKLHEYLSYYIGCQIQRISSSGQIVNYVMLDVEELHRINQDTYPYSIKPILRKLSDMTDEEDKELEAINGTHVIYRSEPNIEIRYDTPETFHWMLKKQFDLFEFIENGLAIDSKTLK